MTYGKLPGFGCGENIEGVISIDAADYIQAKPIIATQIIKAGIRLAKVLNRVPGE
jgi:hypothetical protein